MISKSFLQFYRFLSTFFLKHAMLLRTFSPLSGLCLIICRYTGALFSDFKREVAEKKNKEGSFDCEVNVPVVGSNIRFSIGSLSSLLHSS